MRERARVRERTRARRAEKREECPSSKEGSLGSGACGRTSSTIRRLRACRTNRREEERVLFEEDLAAVSLLRYTSPSVVPCSPDNVGPAVLHSQVNDGKKTKEEKREKRERGKRKNSSRLANFEIVSERRVKARRRERTARERKASVSSRGKLATGASARFSEQRERKEREREREGHRARETPSEEREYEAC